jgi:hypothetical protein
VFARGAEALGPPPKLEYVPDSTVSAQP